MDRWIGRTAVVTGASAGIGAAVCVALANAGMRVVGLARRPERIEKLKSEVRGSGSIVSRKCDIASTEDVAACFKWVEEAMGGTHVLVNNAGVFHDGAITAVGENQMSEEAVTATIDINFKGTVMCARKAIDSMVKNGFDGHVINVNSLAGHYIPFAPKFNVYPASKYAVTAFTGGLLHELAINGSKIKTTSLSPGLVATEMTNLPSSNSVPALAPKDLADAVLYVLSTPPHVNIEELTITPVKGTRL